MAADNDSIDDITSGAIDYSTVSDTCLVLRTLFPVIEPALNDSPHDSSSLHTNNDVTVSDADVISGGLNLDAERVKYVLLSIVNPTLCVVGLVGNTLNVIVMTRRRMRSSLDGRMERAARTGLVSLAAADMICCAVSLAIALFGVERTFFRSSRDDRFRMLVVAYGPYVQNAVARTSTWLTVVTAVGRYFAICRPLQTRHVAAEPLTTRVAVTVAFVGCAIMELPTAWTYRIVSIDCRSPTGNDDDVTSGVDDAMYYMLDLGPFGSDDRLRTASTVVGAVVGFLLPAAILSFCTARLLAALRESTRIARCCQVDARQSYKRRTAGDSMSNNSHGGSGSSARGRRLTVTLVAIVVCFLLLISPSELLHMFYYAVQREHWDSVDVAIAVANVLTTANFALNFVLYCAFNSQFRATWRHLFCPRLTTRSPPSNGLHGVGGGVPKPTRDCAVAAGAGATVRYDRRQQNAVATMSPACTSAAQATTASGNGRTDLRLPVVVAFSRQDATTTGSRSRSSTSSAATR